MKITIYSTKGAQKLEHVTESKTWGELKREISSTFDLENLTATENITRRDLTVDTAILPEQDFNLFLRPKSTKLGGYTYKEAKDIIKNYPKKYREILKEKFGRDYTHLTLAQLNSGIQEIQSLEEDDDDTKSFDDARFFQAFSEFLKSYHYFQDILTVPDFYLEVEVDGFVYSFTQDYLEEDDIKALEKEAEDIFG